VAQRCDRALPTSGLLSLFFCSFSASSVRFSVSETVRRLCVLTNAPDARADNHIVTENLKAGTGSWRLTRPANDAISQAKGYADRLSVTPGQTIRFHIAVNPSQQYSLRIYRLGYYQGLGGRQVWARTNITGRIKGRCPMNATTGQSTCAWSSDVSLQIPAGWVTGIYVAKITNSQGFI